MICLFLTRHHNQGLFLHLLHDVPDAFVTDHIRLLLGRDGFMPVFYTDGSLVYPHSVTYRHGAFLVVLDCCLTDGEGCDQVRQWRQTGTFPGSFQRVSQVKIKGTKQFAEQNCKRLCLFVS